MIAEYRVLILMPVKFAHARYRNGCNRHYLYIQSGVGSRLEVKLAQLTLQVDKHGSDYGYEKLQ